MIEPNHIDTVIENDNWDLNTAEALGFTASSNTHENPFIIPDGEEHLSTLKKTRPIATA